MSQQAGGGPGGPSAVPCRGGGGAGWVAAAAWTGLAVGLAESALYLGRVHLAQGGLYRKSPHVLWTVPLADVAIFAALGMFLSALVRLWPRAGRPLAAFLLGTTALFAVLLTVRGLRAWASLALAAGLASWIAPAILARPSASRRLAVATTPILVLALLALAVVAVARNQLPASGVIDTKDVRPPNVLLIVLDTVRADATSLNGERGTTPRLADLARRGARFERAVSTSPWTLPSHASLFTGHWSSELAVGPERALDPRVPTLAEFLTRHGYDTAGFVANTPFCAVEYGLARGFGHYEDYAASAADVLRGPALGWLIGRWLGVALDHAMTAAGLEACHPLEWVAYRKDADRINRDALAWIARPRGRPFFAFLNYFDAHDPYLLPAGVEPRSGRGPTTLAERRVLRSWISDTPTPHRPEVFTLARDAYDDCIAYLDDRVGRLIDEIERRGLLRETIVVVTSDHGEHFGEHRGDASPIVGHRQTVFQAEVHVPLLIVAPGRVPAGVTVPGAVSLRDIPATVVALAGLGEDSPFPGRSLVAELDRAGEGPADESEAAALTEFNPRTDLPTSLRYQAGATGLMRAVVTGGSSFLRHGDGREELYDLRRDPGESRDLASDPGSRDLLRRLRRVLDAHAAPAGLGGA